MKNISEVDFEEIFKNQGDLSDHFSQLAEGVSGIENDPKQFLKHYVLISNWVLFLADKAVEQEVRLSHLEEREKLRSQKVVFSEGVVPLRPSEHLKQMGSNIVDFNNGGDAA